MMLQNQIAGFLFSNLFTWENTHSCWELCLNVIHTKSNIMNSWFFFLMNNNVYSHMKLSILSGNKCILCKGFGGNQLWWWKIIENSWNDEAPGSIVSPLMKGEVALNSGYGRWGTTTKYVPYGTVIYQDSILNLICLYLSPAGLTGMLHNIWPNSIFLSLFK